MRKENLRKYNLVYLGFRIFIGSFDEFLYRMQKSPKIPKEISENFFFKDLTLIVS